ncbi:MAG: hypothetical protein IJS93_00400 [Clostridia bacterium]|nr:hypothetical protein [Clostridia bacterium]
MNLFGDNNNLWLIVLLCCCGSNCLCDILPLLLILECCGSCGGNNMGCGQKFGGCGCK